MEVRNDLPQSIEMPALGGCWRCKCEEDGPKGRDRDEKEREKKERSARKEWNVESNVLNYRQMSVPFRDEPEECPRYRIIWGPLKPDDKSWGNDSEITARNYSAVDLKKQPRRTADASLHESQLSC